MSRAIRPDAQAFDEIRLVTNPRYKTSGLSGDEWRISVSIQFFRKGRMIHEDFCGHDMSKAVQFVAWKYTEACDNGKAFFAGEEDFCDQEGCNNKATVKYRLKKKYCAGWGCCGQEMSSQEIYKNDYRMFCDRHKKRGDCSIEDCDANYEIAVENSTNSPR